MAKRSTGEVIDFHLPVGEDRDLPRSKNTILIL